jgi:membrane protease YdiL (CAAX protease family)
MIAADLRSRIVWRGASMMGVFRFLRNIITLKDSEIGKGLRQSPRLFTRTAVIAVAILVPYLLLTTPTGQLKVDPGRGLTLTLAIIALLYLGLVASGVPGTASVFGIRWTPKQGWLYWLFVSAAFGIIELIVLLIWGQLFDTPLVRPGALTWHRFSSSCLVSPVYEEILFRMMLCPLAVALAGSWGGIAITGVLFWYSHYVAGVGAPMHLLGGFAFAWFFVKSETIVLPIVLHSLGNLFLLVWAAILLAGTPSLPLVPAENKHPAEEKGIRSTDSHVTTTIRFVNNSKQTIKVYVLNYQGERQFQGTVKDGQTLENTNTSPTHAWLITDENDKAWYIYSPDAQPRTVEIVAPEKGH